MRLYGMHTQIVIFCASPPWLAHEYSQPASRNKCSKSYKISPETSYAKSLQALYLTPLHISSVLQLHQSCIQMYACLSSIT